MLSIFLYFFFQSVSVTGTPLSYWHIGIEPLLLASVVKRLGCLSSSGMKDDHISESPQNTAINE